MKRTSFYGWKTNYKYCFVGFVVACLIPFICICQISVYNYNGRYMPDLTYSIFCRDYLLNYW